MQKTMVYQFEYRDHASGSWQVSPDFATERAIAQIGGVVLYATGCEVDAGLVTFSGIVRPAEK